VSVTVLDPVLSDDEAQKMLDLWHAYESYGQYSNEGFDTEYAPELAQRYDAAANFVRTGGRFGRREDPGMLAARTNYFRETYFYGENTCEPGIEVFRDAEGLFDAAHRLHGRPVMVPAIVYANILLPGQELAVHTDVPEFRGANRRIVPQWLLVAMHHSGLFDTWRMPIATAIAYFGEAQGGELVYYPDGPDGEPVTYPPRHNSAAVLDTDSVFHGVDRVAGDDGPLDRLKPGMRLQHEGNQRWTVRTPGGDIIASYRSSDIRYSVSWKAYCFADEAERDAWANHTDDLSLERILEVLEDDLRERGRLDGPTPPPAEFGKLIIDSYIRFPDPAVG
jgi:hypothetical protein